MKKTRDINNSETREIHKEMFFHGILEGFMYEKIHLLSLFAPVHDSLLMIYMMGNIIVNNLVYNILVVHL